MTVSVGFVEVGLDGCWVVLGFVPKLVVGVFCFVELEVSSVVDSVISETSQQKKVIYAEMRYIEKIQTLEEFIVLINRSCGVW